MKNKKLANNDKIQFEKLAKQFNDFLASGKGVNEVTLKKEAQFTPKPHLEREFVAEETHDRRFQDEQEQEHQRALQKIETESLNIENQIAQERQQEILTIEKDMKELNSLFVEVSTLVTTQGAQITVIEQNTEQTLSKVVEANKELVKVDWAMQFSGFATFNSLFFFLIRYIPQGLRISTVFEEKTMLYSFVGSHYTWFNWSIRGNLLCNKIAENTTKNKFQVLIYLTNLNLKNTQTITQTK